ncbi:MAG: xylulokinase [Clostridiaceae bacterium]
MLYIGADLGTSGLKMILMDEKGKIQASVTEKYPVFYPHSGWSEQNPTDWADALIRGINNLTHGVDKSQIKAIGIDGQMHGLIMLDDGYEVIRPAILWNDTRTSKEVAYLNEEIGEDKITAYTGNIAFAGFTAPKVLWVKENEPDNFKKIRSILLPKDYLNFNLTGNLTTDLSDASGMLLLDVKNKKWSDEMIDLCGLKSEVLPKLYESTEVIGTLTERISELTGLSKDVAVVAGAGDNAAAAIGAGTVGYGKCNISIGTSGTVFVVSDKFKEGKNNAVHNFVHSDGNYHFLGCMLSAASCIDWWMKTLNTQDYEEEQSKITALGDNRILFLPYLMGERSPHNDENARGAFLGLSLTTSRADMTQAVLEGVAFALKDSLEIIEDAGVTVDYSTLCGGGAKSELWQRILANVLDIEIGILENEEGPALGSALLAAVGSGLFPDIETACREIVKIKKTIKPEKETVKKYKELYEIYKKGYYSVKAINDSLSKI